MSTEETMQIEMLELRHKNDVLWMFVHIYIPFAQGNLDKYLDIAVEAHRWHQQEKAK